MKAGVQRAHGVGGLSPGSTHRSSTPTGRATALRGEVRLEGQPAIVVRREIDDGTDPKQARVRTAAGGMVALSEVARRLPL